MAFVVSDLTGWVNSNSQELLTKSVLESETIPYITVLPGVKYKQELKYISTNAIIQAASCGYNTNGSTTLTGKDVSVTALKVQEDLCPADLDTTSMQLSMRPGFNTSIPFAALIAEQKVKEVNKAIEVMIWANHSGDTTHFAGLQSLFIADSDVHDITDFDWTATGNTASDYIGAVYEMQNTLPAEVQSLNDLTLFVGHEVFRKVVQQLVISNLYHIDLAVNNGLTPFMFPGTNIKLVPVNGLNGLGFAALTPASNLVYVTDLQSESDAFKMWWSEDFQTVKSSITWKSGITYYYGDYIVYSI